MKKTLLIISLLMLSACAYDVQHYVPVPYGIGVSPAPRVYHNNSNYQQPYYNNSPNYQYNKNNKRNYEHQQHHDNGKHKGQHKNKHHDD